MKTPKRKLPRKISYTYVRLRRMFSYWDGWHDAETTLLQEWSEPEVEKWYANKGVGR